MVDSRRIEHQVCKSRPIRAATIIRDGKSSAEAPRPPESRTTAGLLGRDREQPGLVTVGNHVVKREVERHRQFLTVTLTLVVPLLPAASRTVAVTMWVPFVMPVVVHGTETGPEPETCVATCRPSTDSV